MAAKSKPLSEVQFLAFLEKALSKIVNDLKLRSAIQDAVTKEIRLHNNVASFTKFCETGSVPDFKPETMSELQDQLAATFGDDAKVEITAPDPDGTDIADRKGALAVEITMPDRTITSQIKVDPTAGTDEGDGAPKAPFVPFPVTLPEDPALVWTLARREDLGPDEAGRALAHIEELFWESKSGQQMQRKGTEKTFAEFIANVPSAALLDSGMKRHYKEPETVHALRQLEASSSGSPAPTPKSRQKEKPSADVLADIPFDMPE